MSLFVSWGNVWLTGRTVVKVAMVVMVVVIVMLVKVSGRLTPEPMRPKKSCTFRGTNGELR